MIATEKSNGTSRYFQVTDFPAIRQIVGGVIVCGNSASHAGVDKSENTGVKRADFWVIELYKKGKHHNSWAKNSRWSYQIVYETY